MAAITKTWTDIADAAVDPDSPLTTSLITALRDNAIWVREWLGYSFTGAAVQDHNHDGTNSARVDVGPNYLRNASFEDGDAGWTFTDYTGGSHAISTSVRRHGAKSAAITSTVLANGGGEALSNEYIPIAEGQPYSFSAWIWASGTNISAKLQVVYYDGAQSAVSTVDLAVQTNTPTSATRHTARDTPPSNARFARIKVIGGVPSSGSSTGTVYFDGIAVGLGVFQLALEASAVGRTELKTTTASGSVGVSASSSGSYSLAGSTYSWWTGSSQVSGGASNMFGNSDTGAGVIGVYNTSGGVQLNFYVDERYVQASPPYDLGNGEVPLFVWAMLDGAGNVVGSQVAPDPTWAYHGPTNIVPEFYRGNRPFRRYAQVNGVPLHSALRNRALAQQLLQGEASIEWVEREITTAFKNTDMAIAPHPFVGNDMTGRSVVLIDPVGVMAERLQAIQADQGAREVRDLLLGDYLRIDNTPLDAITPPGVQAVRARFTDSQGV
jgi:hypothetical protein